MLRAMSGGDRRGLAATAVTAVLIVSGMGCLGMAVVRQEQEPPQPPLSTLEQVGPPAPHPATPDRPSSRPPTEKRKAGPTLPASVPIALAIPAIDVRSPLQQLGLASDGTIEVPAPGRHYDEPGWYRYSPTPGSLGPAIIVGHLDSPHGRSIFYWLGGLKPHDSVLVTRADGSVAVFAVDAVRRYRKSRFPTQLVYGNTNHAALRLITCGGPIDRRGHHRDNIVVLASMVQAIGRGQPTTTPANATQRTQSGPVPS